MKIAVLSPVSQNHYSLRIAVLLLLLLSFTVGACGAPATTEVPTATASAVPTPTLAGPVIESVSPCEIKVGEKMPLVVSGISDTGFTYRWTATSGSVEPAEGPAVNYVPDEPGAVIIRVEAEKDGVASDATINCTVIGPTLTPEVPTPTLTPTPSPTQWACSSFRPEKLQDADVPGTVTIDTPPQGTVDLQSRTSIQVTGTYSGIPEGKYLWVFIYSGDAGLHGRYYPQTVDALKNWQPVPITEPEGRWSIDVGFGAPNLCYEVIVLVADAEASKSIADQLKAWADLDNYAGYELNGPETAIPPDAPGFPDGLVEKASIEVKTR